MIRILRIKREGPTKTSAARSLLQWFYEDIGCDLWVTWLWPSPANFACSMPMSLHFTPGYCWGNGFSGSQSIELSSASKQKYKYISALTIRLRWSSSCWGWRCAAACSSWGCRGPRCSRLGRRRSLKLAKITSLLLPASLLLISVVSVAIKCKTLHIFMTENCINFLEHRTHFFT